MIAMAIQACPSQGGKFPENGGCSPPGAIGCFAKAADSIAAGSKASSSNFGVALACMAMLAGAPFSQRSLVLMGAGSRRGAVVAAP